MPIDGYGPPYGLGTSSTPNASTGATLRDTATGNSWGSRLIDPVTRNYVIDSNGRTLGMSDVQQLVLIAVRTDLGSSVLSDLGQELQKIDRITPNFQRRARETLERAVSHLVAADLVEVVDVITDVVGPGRASTRMLWRDLTQPPGTPPISTVV